MSIRTYAGLGEKPLKARVTPLNRMTRAARPRALRRPALVPAAARPTSPLTGEELGLSDAVETFALAVGGRKKLLQTLAVGDNGCEKVVNALLDPRYNDWSLRRLCAHAGLTVVELFAAYKRALFAQAHIEAAHIITEKLPAIVEDVMQRALPGKGVCPRCNGIPTTLDTSDCPQCGGTGMVPTEPELPRQKLALELGRLIERHAGVMVQQNAIAAGTTAIASTAPGSLEQLQQAVGDLLFSPTRRRAASPAVVVEAQPVPPQEPADALSPSVALRAEATVQSR